MTPQGFTLIELLLYVGICATLLLVVSLFFGQLLESRIKNQTIAEVEGQGLEIMQHITRTIRNAQSVISPLPGLSSSSLSLDVTDPTDDPTLFTLVSETLHITEGLSAPIALTNARVSASGIIFQNLSRSDTPGTIRVQFTLAHVNPLGRNEYAYAKTFIGSASLRQ